MVKLKLKTLQTELENVDDFNNPKLFFEQYMTRPQIAAEMLYHIEMNYGDIDNKIIADLGCGTGMLSLAASLLGAVFCLGMDIDEEALSVCNENIIASKLKTIEVVKWDVQQQLRLGENHPMFQKFDTVLINPPFGTKTKKNIDIDFVKFGLLLTKGTVYSLHKTAHFKTIQREMKKIGVNVIQDSNISFDLPRTHKIHKHENVDISVQLLRFKRHT